MSFKEFLNEATDKILTSGSIAGSGLIKSFTEQEHNDIIKALKSNPKSNKIKNWITEFNDSSIKYSDTLILVAKNMRFTLYAANGMLRIGGGGSYLTSARMLAEKITAEDIIKAVSKAEIK